MAINRALMNRQMYNMGGSSLQTGAPDITLTGDMRPTYSAMRKQRMAGGGIAGLQNRQGYFLGSLVDKIRDDLIPNEIKENPIVSGLVGAGLLNQFGLPDAVTEYLNMGSNVGKNFIGDLISKIPGTPDYVDTVFGGTQGINPKDLIFGLPDDPYTILGEEGGDQRTYAEQYLQDFGKNALGQIVEKATGQVFGTGPNTTNMTDAQKNQLALEQYRRKNLQTDLAKALAAGSAAGAYVESQPKDTLPTDTTGLDIPAITTAARGTDADAAAAGLRFLPPQVTRAANGGRIGAQEGGLMDLGGMEKDYREEGGFVPIGGREKADDVPARLSKNEFVFTADAVRNAGGGDIDEGAAIMERMMKNLEQGGQVSEESQGLEGAREMFETSQRLEKRII